MLLWPSVFFYVKISYEVVHLVDFGKALKIFFDCIVYSMEQIHHHTRPKIRQAIIQVSSQKVEYCSLVFLGLVIRRAMFGYFGKYGQTFEFSMFFSHLTRHSFHLTWKNIVLQDFKSFLKGFDWKDDCLKINVFALFDNYKYAINYGQSSY